jgi:anti-sigma B factor antagonist
LATAETRRFELDLAGVTFIDSSGLGMVVDARTACESQGTTFTITGVPDRIRRVFVLSGLEMLLASPPEAPSA